MVCGECGSVLEELLPQQILALEKLDKLKAVKTNVANDKLII
jgi:hypothetical protein